MIKKVLLLILFFSTIISAQSIPHVGTNPMDTSDFAPYDWTAPLNFPNNNTKFLRGDWTWAVPSGGGGVTPNTTVGVIPYLSATGVYSDSPLIRINANTVGSPASADLNINVPSGQTLRLQKAGSTVIAVDSTGIELSQKINQISGFGTSGNFGVPAIAKHQVLDGHNEATRTDDIFTAGGGLGPGLGGTYEFTYTYNTAAVQAGASMQATINWTDKNSNAQSVTTSSLSLATVGQISGTVAMRLRGNISVTTTTTSIGVGFYDAAFTLKQIN